MGKFDGAILSRTVLRVQVEGKDTHSHLTIAKPTAGPSASPFSTQTECGPGWVWAPLCAHP